MKFFRETDFFSFLEQVFIHFNFNDLVQVHADRIYTVPGDEFSAGYIQEFVELYRELKDKI